MADLCTACESVRSALAAAQVHGTGQLTPKEWHNTALLLGDFSYTNTHVGINRDNTLAVPLPGKWTRVFGAPPERHNMFGESLDYVRHSLSSITLLSTFTLEHDLQLGNMSRGDTVNHENNYRLVIVHGVVAAMLHNFLYVHNTDVEKYDANKMQFDQLVDTAGTSLVNAVLREDTDKFFQAVHYDRVGNIVLNRPIAKTRYKVKVLLDTPSTYVKDAHVHLARYSQERPRRLLIHRGPTMASFLHVLARPRDIAIALTAASQNSLPGVIIKQISDDVQKQNAALARSTEERSPL